jgi:hypothetical protein
MRLRREKGRVARGDLEGREGGERIGEQRDKEREECTRACLNAGARARGHAHLSHRCHLPQKGFVLSPPTARPRRHYRRCS